MSPQERIQKLRWLSQAEGYLAQVRSELTLNPEDANLRWTLSEIGWCVYRIRAQLAACPLGRTRAQGRRGAERPIPAAQGSVVP